MKKILAVVFGFGFLSMAGCLKDTPNNDFSTIGTIIEIPYSGLEYFASDALNFTADTITLDFVVNVASVYPLNSDVTVTLGIDDAKRTAYNATSAVQYEAMPAAAYSFPVTTAVIKAGTRQATFSITFYKSEVDASKNLMLPISLTDAQGNTISGNFGTKYYHAIGNCVAGSYSASGTRTGFVGTVEGGVVAYVVPIEDYDPDKVLAPLDPVTVVANYADLGVSGWQYVIVFDCGTNTIVSVGPNDAMAAGITANSFKVYQPPTYDAATSTFHFLTGYTNTAGNQRQIDETFVKK